MCSLRRKAHGLKPMKRISPVSIVPELSDLNTVANNPSLYPDMSDSEIKMLYPKRFSRVMRKRTKALVALQAKYPHLHLSPKHFKKHPKKLQIVIKIRNACCNKNKNSCSKRCLRKLARNTHTKGATKT